MKRRAIYIFCSFLIVILGFSGCSKNDNAEGQVTRGEWIAMLSDAFVLDTYNSDSPYYSDITNNNALFSSVQASAEWGILSIFDGDRLNADLPITCDEAASTAAIAAGFAPEANGAFDTRASIDYAIEYGIISKAGKNHLTKDECVSIIESAQNLYLTNPGEERMIVEYADNLVDLRGVSSQFILIDESEVSFFSSLTTADSATIKINGQEIQIKVGDSILTPATEEYPVGSAYKIVSIREENGQAICSVTAPSFGDIFNYADIHTTISLLDDSIIWADGVKVTPLSSSETSTDNGSYHIQLLSNWENNGIYMQSDANTFSHNWRVKFNTGVKRIYKGIIPAFLRNSPEARALESSNFIYNTTPSILDFGGSLQTWTKELEKVNKYEDGYDITVDLGVQLSAIVDISYHKLHFFGAELDLWPESASMVLHSNITVDFDMEGSIGKEKKLELGKVMIPIGETGLTVDGYLFLYLDATGKVEIKLEMENVQRTGWNIEEGRQGYQSPVRKTPGQPGNKYSAEVMGSVDLSVGMGWEVDLSAFSTVKLIGADWKIGGDLEAKGTLTGKSTEQITNEVTTRHYIESIKLGSTFYLPLSTITVSGPDGLSDILGLEKSWEIISKKGANQIPFTEAEWIIWERTVKHNEIGEFDIDFSSYVGEYEPYKLMEGQTASALYINGDGTIRGESGYSGGGVAFSNPLSGNDIKPISIIKHESGAIECVLADEEFDTTTVDGMSRIGFRIRYIIYPPGVIQDESGLYAVWLDDTKDKIRIEYLHEDNGVEDIRYCQSSDEKDVSNEIIDISLYVGTYEPYARGDGVLDNYSYSNLILNNDGSLQGTFTYSSENRNFTNEIAGDSLIPSQIDYREDGTIYVELLFDGDFMVCYNIIPPGVDISSYSYIPTEFDAQANKDKIRIIYSEGVFGAMGNIFYYKT